MDDFEDLTQLPETASKDRELLSSKSMNAMLLIEQLGTECKGRPVVYIESLFVYSVVTHTQLV